MDGYALRSHPELGAYGNILGNIEVRVQVLAKLLPDQEALFNVEIGSSLPELFPQVRPHNGAIL